MSLRGGGEVKSYCYETISIVLGGGMWVGVWVEWGWSPKQIIFGDIMNVWSLSTQKKTCQFVITSNI